MHEIMCKNFSLKMTFFIVLQVFYCALNCSTNKSKDQDNNVINHFPLIKQRPPPNSTNSVKIFVITFILRSSASQKIFPQVGAVIKSVNVDI